VEWPHSDIENRRLIGRFFETDFASFVAWRDWGWPDRSIFNCFGSAVILSSDGAVLMGRMSARTLNAGKVYPPGGSLEPRDLLGNGEIDVLGSIARELKEETGLAAEDARPAGLIAVFDEQRISIAHGLRFSLTAGELIAAAEHHWQSDEQPELDGLVVVRDLSQLDSSMPGYAKDIARYYLRHAFA
jgi:8-oxo-dGTP pyrophosphatase MutT (NUDIX family)